MVCEKQPQLRNDLDTTNSMIATLVRVGYWRSEQHPECPYPQDSIDTDRGDEERESLGNLLDHGLRLHFMMGYSVNS